MRNKYLPEIEYLSQKYGETNIPLYLSYPTTSWWKETTDSGKYIQSCHKEENPFFYFHFPYCKKACYYCCCYKAITLDENKKEIYIRYLKKELIQKMSMLKVDRFLNVKHMHWGGGTPTYLTPGQIEYVFSMIKENMEIVNDADSSISIEAYPDDEILDYKKLKLLRDLGFNEISFGIQDFDQRIQKAINRNCKPGTVKKIISQSRELGFRVHIDLCYGLPFQGLGEIENTIRHIIEINPDRIAVFPYAHYPFIFPLQKMIPLSSIPDSFTKVLLIKRAGELLTGCGYKRIGIDHFVRPDNPLYKAAKEKKIIKDFMGYSVNQRRSFIGFGASAISFLRNSYFQNTNSLDTYYDRLTQYQLPLKYDNAHALSGDDIIRNRIIQKSILCDFMIDKREIGRIFHIDFDEYFRPELTILKDYEKDGLIEHVSADRIVITPKGKNFSRHIAYVFDRYYQDNPNDYFNNHKNYRKTGFTESGKRGVLYELSGRIN